jgi:hypothetical protein
MCINEFLRRSDSGDFLLRDVHTQCKAGWYDWFCKDSKLVTKTRKLTKKLRQVLKADAGKNIDCESTYVWFKNNCPLDGTLYDDFRIASREDGRTLFTIIPYDGHRCIKGIASVWGTANGFKAPLVEGKWKDVLNFFKKGKI